MNQRRNRSIRKAGTITVLPLPSVLFAVMTAAGIACGYFISALFSEDTAQQLSEFLKQYASLSQTSAESASVISMLVCYLRAPLLIFLCAFSAVGVVCLPILCCAEGFLLSFSLCSFARLLGSAHFLLLVGMFLPRLLFYLPSMLLLCCLAWQNACAWFTLGRGKRGAVCYDAPYFTRFVLLIVLSLFGCVVELTLLPRLLGAANF